MYEYKATLIRVVDGDTLRLDVDVGFHIHVHMNVRLANVDAPEAATPQGRILTQRLTEYMSQHKDVIIRTRRWDRYGRWLADVTVADSGTNLNRLVRKWIE